MKGYKYRAEIRLFREGEDYEYEPGGINTDLPRGRTIESTIKNAMPDVFRLMAKKEDLKEEGLQPVIKLTVFEIDGPSVLVQITKF